MKTFKLLPLLVLPVAVHADVVQNEVFGSYTSTDPDDVAALSYTHYLNAMNTNGAVKEELPFLRRTGYLNAVLLEADGDNAADLGGRFFLNSDLFFGANYTFDTDDTSDGTLSVHGGNYFAENSAYQLTLSRNFAWDTTGVELGTHTVTALSGGASLAWGVGAGAQDVSEISDTLMIRGDATYYFTDYTGVGLDLVYDEVSEFTSYQFEFSHYLNDRVGVILAAGEAYENLEQVTLAVRARF